MRLIAVGKELTLRIDGRYCQHSNKYSMFAATTESELNLCASKSLAISIGEAKVETKTPTKTHKTERMGSTLRFIWP